MARRRRIPPMPPPRLRPGDVQKALPLAVLVLLVVLLSWYLDRREARVDNRPVPPGEYLFCSWNVENLFDDEDDPTLRDDLEDWFAAEPAALRQKLDLLADALLRLNGGRGPDILALVEVENRRAVELLRDTLNARLPVSLQYTSLVHRDNRNGRRIEPALLSRLRAVEDETHSYGARRILAARIGPDDSPLHVIVGHWTSRVTEAEGEGEKRLNYAKSMYRGFLAAYEVDPEADVLMAGDFNDEPDDESLREGLRATADPAAVRTGDVRPRLLNLTERLGPAAGTYYYRGKWERLDHLVASPGLLGPPGWRVVPDGVAVIDGPHLRMGAEGRPRRFGTVAGRDERGPSDHFAVTVRLAR